MNKPTDSLNLHFILPMDPTCHINFLIFLPTSLLSLRCRQQIRRTCWPAANLLRHCIIPRLILAAAAPPFASLAGVREPQLRLAVGLTPSVLLPRPVAGAGGGS